MENIPRFDRDSWAQSILLDAFEEPGVTSGGYAYMNWELSDPSRIFPRFTVTYTELRYAILYTCL